MHHAEQADNKLNMHAVLVWLNCACRSTIYLSFYESSTNKILVCMGHVHALFKGDCSETMHCTPLDQPLLHIAM